MSDRTKRKRNDTNNNMPENLSNETYALTNEQKERIYSTIYRKLNIEMTDSGKAVSGVEKCSRSQIFRVITTAASTAVVIAALGINFSLMHNMKKGISEISVRDDSIATSETAIQFIQEKKPQITEAHKAAVGDTVTTAVPPVKAVSVSISERLLTTYIQTTAITTIFTEAETTEETSITEITETETETTEAVQNEESDSQEEIIPQNDEPSEEDKLRETAEELIAGYDNILKIKTINILKEGDDEKLTLTHEASANGGQAFILNYRLVDPEIYPDMKTMKDYYYSIICSSKNENNCFGPEFSSTDHEVLSLPGDSPTYSYITYNGRLYGLDISKPVFTVPTDEPAVISNIGEYGFSAEKKYKDMRDENKITTARFSIVKDTKTGRYVILTVNYN